MDNWETETDQESEHPELEYKVKAHLVLEGSDKHEWGVVKDCHGCINHIPEDAEVVGSWNKYGDGVCWVSLQTPIEALQDKATRLFVELSERRKAESVGLGARKRTPARRKEAEEELESGPSPFDGLRESLKGGG